MKFKHTETQPDGGGNLTITAETKPEIIELIQHFRIFDTDTPEGCLKMAEALQGDTYTHESKPTKRFWYAIESALDYDSTKPYADLLERLTGYGSQGEIIPDLDWTSKHPRRLCHTHITDRLTTEHGHICFLAYDAAEDWNDRTAADNAVRNCTDYIVEDFGFRKWEREYITAGNGQLKHNPNYLKRHRAQPGLGAEWFWKALFEWWTENKATPAQREILKRHAALKTGISDFGWQLRKGGGEQASLIDYSGLYCIADTGHDWDGKGTKFEIVKWEDFAKAA